MFLKSYIAISPDGLFQMRSKLFGGLSHEISKIANGSTLQNILESK